MLREIKHKISRSIKFKVKLPPLKIEIKPTYALPSWYGVAYYDFNKMVAITMPFPLFIVIGLLIRIQSKIMAINMDTKETRTYESAFLRGKEEGKDRALLSIERELSNQNLSIDRRTLKITKEREISSKEIMKEMDTLL